MTVKRIVANIHAADIAAARAFYRDVLGLEVAMDQGWIATLAATGATMTPQLSVMTEGGSVTPVPALSIEVDDLDEVLARCRAAGFAPCYGPQREPWGVRRFYVIDPTGITVNILQHEEQS